MSTNLRLDEKQIAKYYNMLPPICTKLGIDVPELFVELDVHPNTYTYGDTKPFIVITSGLFETLPDELIPTVLAHECGHIACHHTLYTTMGFTNIKTKRNTEAVKIKEGNIISITINESAEDGWYKRTDEVLIEYFEAKTDEEIALEHPGEIKIGENQKD